MQYKKWLLDVINPDISGITSEFNDSAIASPEITPDPPRYVIQNELPPNWAEIRESVSRKSAKRQQEVKAEAKAPYQYLSILRTALDEGDADTWNSTIEKLRVLHPDEIIVFDDDKTVNNGYLEGFDFRNIEFRNVKFSRNIMIECSFDGASFDLSQENANELHRGGIFENCTFVACSMNMKAFRENEGRLTESGQTFITENDANLPNAEADEYRQPVPLFDRASIDKVDEFMTGRRTEVEGLYKSGCEFIDCIIPVAMETELATPDANGRQAYMIHMSTNEGISQEQPNPYAAAIRENAESLTDYYDPRSARAKQERHRAPDIKRSCDAAYKWTQRTNHLGGKQN